MVGHRVLFAWLGRKSMQIRVRVAKLKRSLGGRPPPDQLDLVVAVPVGCGMADALPPGVHLNADGQVATVVYEGAGPDEAVMARLKARLAPSGLAVTAHP